MTLDDERGLDKVWAYRALCVRTGQVLTQSASARSTTPTRTFLETLDRAYPQGDLYLVANHLSSHSSGQIREWLADHSRFQHDFIPVGVTWLNLIEDWWRLFRREAFAGASLAGADDIAYATRLASAQLNRHASSWVWGRSPPPHRQLRCCFVYRL